MKTKAYQAIRRHKSQTTLADVFCGIEPGDKLEYSNQFGQTFIGTVDSLIKPSTIIMRREGWQKLGFGPELLNADDYYLESVLR